MRELLIRWLGLAVLLLPLVGEAHTVRPAVVTVNAAASGELSVTIRVSAELLLARIGPEYADTNDAPNAAEYDAYRALDPQALEAEFAGFVPEFMAKTGLLSGGTRLPLRFERIEIPPVGDLELARDSEIVLSGELPASVEPLTWSWPREYGGHVIRFVGSDPAQAYSVWLQPGETHEPWLPGVTSARGGWGVVVDYIAIGFEHIVPKGLDHILFVLGLFLLSAKLGPLLWQVSAFTVAHTITLGLSIYGVLALPPAIVEPLIALSIAYVGIENCVSGKLQPWRVLLVFVFGLLHGMGFAGVLQEIGLPDGEFVTALISFNVGVELGQLAVILAAFLLVGWFRNADWYRQRIVIPASLVIAVTGLYWAWERIAG
ncbi:MAG: HupE/UreJ family protein [Gammaproteobacteria bacterium]|nr:HupE/UreJ family protein [Gammaproteobacteria bacterium]